MTVRVALAALVAALATSSCTGSPGPEIARDVLIADGPQGPIELAVEVPTSIAVGQEQMLYRYTGTNRSSNDQTAAVDVGLDGAPTDCDLNVASWPETATVIGYPRLNMDRGDSAGATALRDVPAECVGTFDVVFRISIVPRDEEDVLPASSEIVLASSEIVRMPITIKP